MTALRDIPFNYTPMSPKCAEIRLIKLFPGKFHDDLFINIIHVPFMITALSNPSNPDRLTLKELEQTLPSDWGVRETIEGRYLFICKSSSSTSWMHPNPSFDPKRYAGFPGNPQDEHNLEYEALSYTWGNETSSEPLYVLPEGFDSHSESQLCLRVRPNLAEVLRHCRRLDETRTLWIDAICINQKDHAEVDRQLILMGDIYRKAHHVVIWIGPKSDSSELSLNKLRYLGQQVEHTADGYYPSPDADNPQWSSPKFILPFSDESWASIKALLSRPYFGRVWVNQEARLARFAIVQCGLDTLPWNLFRRAIITLRENPSAAKRLTNHIDNVRELCSPRYLGEFFRLILMSRKRSCTNPRDKLYGIRSLISPRLAQDIVPQHTKPVVDVYKDAFLASCALEQRLDLLSHINQKASSWEFPSWVPDWSNGIDNFLQATFFGPAAGMSRACFELTDSDVLEVRGVCMGKVAHADSVIEGTSGKIFPVWQHHSSLGGEQKQKSDNTLLLPFLDLILVNGTRELYPTNLSYPSLWELREKYLLGLKTGGIALEQLPEVRVASLRNLSFIMTSDGRLGLAPAQTEPDDIICFFLGCHLPVVLRRLPLDIGFKLLGPCLIHGAKNGEALIGDLPKPWRFEFYRDATGHSTLHFYNTVTNDLTTEDPRLPPLPPEWEKLDKDRSTDDPRWFAYFRNKVTGDIINSDPRMLPEALCERGVKLETFRLV